MRLPYIALGVGGVFLIVCLIAFFLTSRPDVEENVVTEESPAATSTAATSTPVTFTEEGRQPSAPANALGAAPVCDQGIADRGANEEEMRMGNISAYTKESVIQAILKRNELLRTAPASCIRTYFRVAMIAEGEDWSELESMSDERLVVLARFMAEMGREDGETAGAFRERMLGNEAQWMYEGPEMNVGFTEQVQNGSVTTYQEAYFHNGAWY